MIRVWSSLAASQKLFAPTWSTWQLVVGRLGESQRVNLLFWGLHLGDTHPWDWWFLTPSNAIWSNHYLVLSKCTLFTVFRCPVHYMQMTPHKNCLRQCGCYDLLIFFWNTITLFRAITMLCQNDNILWKFLHIHYCSKECYVGMTVYCEIFLKFIRNVRNILRFTVIMIEYYEEYCQFRKTLLWL